MPGRAITHTASVPTCVSDVVVVASDDGRSAASWPQRPRFPPLHTVAYGYCTSTDTDPEQLFVVSDSPVTASTHAP